MGKRFTASEKFEDPWFRKLTTKYKVFWEYILAKCNNAGIWAVDMELAEFQIGEKLSIDEIKAEFNGRIKDLGNGYWFIPKFIEFQYGVLSPDCKPHVPVVFLLTKFGLWKGYSKGIHTLQEKEKEKDKEKDIKEDRGVGEDDFNELWKAYPNKDGRKEALRHFLSSVSTKEDIPKIQQALKNYLGSKNVREGFIKNGSTWFNNWKDWINYSDKFTPPPPDPNLKEKMDQKNKELMDLARRSIKTTAEIR